MKLSPVHSPTPSHLAVETLYLNISTKHNNGHEVGYNFTKKESNLFSKHQNGTDSRKNESPKTFRCHFSKNE